MTYYILTYSTERGPWGWSYRWFRSARALVRFCKTSEVTGIVSIEEV